MLKNIGTLKTCLFLLYFHKKKEREYLNLTRKGAYVIFLGNATYLFFNYSSGHLLILEDIYEKNFKPKGLISTWYFPSRKS